MRKWLFVILLMAGSLSASDNQQPLSLMKMSQAPIIDGIIDPVWNQVDSVSDFVQHQPYHGAEPSHRTVARILTTNDALYSLVVCYDEEEHIQLINGKLDDISGDATCRHCFGVRTTSPSSSVLK